MQENYRLLNLSFEASISWTLTPSGTNIIEGFKKERH